METQASVLVVRLAKMGTRLQSYATAAEGIAVTGGFVAVVSGVVMACQTGHSATGARTHPQFALGFAVVLAGVLFGATMMVLSRVVAVMADYVSVAHLVEVAEN